MIGPERESAILRLYHAEKWPIGTIAKQLGLHHSTVRRVLAQAGVAAGRSMARPSIVDPFVPFIMETLTKYPRLRASRLHAMARERGYEGSQDYFRHVVSRYRPRPPAEAYQRLRTLPGEQGQVDWAHFGKLVVGNALRALWAFVMVTRPSVPLSPTSPFGQGCQCFSCQVTNPLPTAKTRSRDSPHTPSNGCSPPSVAKPHLEPVRLAARWSTDRRRARNS